MDSTTPSAPQQASPADPARTAGAAPPGLGAEVRESLVLLAFAVAATVGLTTAAQAALAVLS